jgi:hypothetical protein
MPTVDVDTTLVAPIPVGHRVRVTFFTLQSRGMFGSSREELSHEPQIEDLNTGILYCSERPFEHHGGKFPRKPLPTGDAPTAEVHKVVEGVVRSCRVVTIRGFAEVDVQTRLVIET